jgi:hypothetical protein
MPFKSKAQRRKFAELLVKGEISADTFEEWNRETGKQRLPERVGARQPRAIAAKKKRTTKIGLKQKAAAKTSARRKSTAKKR